MKFNHVACGLVLGAALLAGCTANVSGTVTPGAMASTSPGSTTAGGSTNANVNANVNTNTSAGGTANADLAALYTKGRKWSYDLTSAGGGGNYSEEVTDVQGTTATVKRTTTIAGTSNSITYNVDLTKKDASSAFTSADANVKVDYSQATATSITVKAGTYDCMHGTGTVASTQTSGGATGSATSSFEYWVSAKVGLIKSVTTTKLDISMPSIPTSNLPPGVTLPNMGGAGGSGDITTTVELASFQ